MRLHRFIIDPVRGSPPRGSFGPSLRAGATSNGADIDLSRSEVLINDAEIVSQIKNVLRLKTGDRVVLSDGNGREAEAEIREMAKGTILVAVVRTFANENEPDRHVILHASLLKREHFELVVQKATEIGVSEIVPVLSARTVKLNLNYDRLRKIIKEAAEQSGRGKVPVLHEATPFSKAVEMARINDLNIFFHLGGESTFAIQKNGRVGVWIGPEGGWSEEEASNAKTHGFHIASLGALTLRAETAAIVGSFLATHN